MFSRLLKKTWPARTDNRPAQVVEHHADGQMLAAADGCRAGWVVAMAESWPCPQPPHLTIYPAFRDMLVATAACRAVVVDMPIGLPAGSEHRQCDETGRRLLGALAVTRLFYAPPRGTLTAADPVAFQKVHRRLTGKGAGLPVWGIVAKLREVDEAMTPALQDRVYEFHPELAWRHLAGAALPSKHGPEGIERRLALLRPLVPDLDALIMARDGLRRKDAGLDDLLDALVGLGVAQAIAAGPDPTRRIPGVEPERDERGLRMEIWF